MVIPHLPTEHLKKPCGLESVLGCEPSTFWSGSHSLSTLCAAVVVVPNSEVKLDESDEEEVPPVASAPEPEKPNAGASVLEESKKEEKAPILVSHSSTAISKSSGDAKQQTKNEVAVYINLSVLSECLVCMWVF